MLTRLRWSAFGLRGRIVGAVLGTTAVTLVVAGLVLLPRLEHALRSAAESTLTTELASAKTSGDLTTLSDIQHYPLISPTLLQSKDKQLRMYATTENAALQSVLAVLTARFGGATPTLIGSIDAQGVGTPIIPVATQSAPSTEPSQSQSTSLSPSPSLGSLQAAVRLAFEKKTNKYGFGSYDGGQVVQAAIWIGPDSVLTVRKSIGDIPLAAKAVRRAFEIAALAAILMTLLIAIPLAGTLVARLRRLRQAALQIAIDGSGRARFPVDRARDEVGDLARSFAIMQRRLRQQEEARRAFVATASHELRTPLASLDGMLELLADDIHAGGGEVNAVDMREAAALLDRARAQSRRLGRLAADLLDLSRLDAEVALRSEPVELSELGRAVMAEFELSSLERGVTAVLSDDAAPVWARADPGSVARILRILLDNALRVAPRWQ